MFVSATYTSPATDQSPSLVKYYMKRSFSKMYWRTMKGSMEWLMGIYFGKTSTRVVEPQNSAEPPMPLVPAR